MLALNYPKVSNHTERISNLIPFTPNYNWYEINFPPGSKEYNAFEKYNDTIARNVFYVPHNENKIRPAYISKFNKTREHHANLLTITEGKDKWHYITIKSIPALLRGVTSAHNSDFYCLNCFHSYRTAKKINEHEELCVKNNFCLIKMPAEDKKYVTSSPGKNTLLFMLTLNVYYIPSAYVIIHQIILLLSRKIYVSHAVILCLHLMFMTNH